MFLFPPLEESAYTIHIWNPATFQYPAANALGQGTIFSEPAHGSRVYKRALSCSLNSTRQPNSSSICKSRHVTHTRNPCRDFCFPSREKPHLSEWPTRACGVLRPPVHLASTGLSLVVAPCHTGLLALPSHAGRSGLRAFNCYPIFWENSRPGTFSAHFPHFIHIFGQRHLLSVARSDILPFLLDFSPWHF